MTDALVKFEQSASELVGLKIAIESRSDFEVVSEALRAVVATRAEIEAERQRVVKPLRQALDSANDLFKRVDARHAEFETVARAELASYHDRCRQEESRLLQLAATSETHSDALALVSEASPVAAGISTRRLRRWRLVDAVKVPDQFWLLDETKIGKAVRAGVEIPGIESYTETSVAVSKGG